MTSNAIQNITPSTHIITPTYVFIFSQLFIVFVVQHLIRKRWRKGLPPGPSGIPLLGNVYDIPQEAPWIAYRDLAAKHGTLSTLLIYMYSKNNRRGCHLCSSSWPPRHCPELRHRRQRLT